VTPVENDSPNFSRPPVVEVALAVQFDEGAVSTLTAAGFRNTLLSRFPKLEERPSGPPMEESFEVAEQVPFKFELLGAPPTPRFWFLNDDGSRVVQLQHDLLAVNWRHLPGGVDYPRFRLLRDELRELLGSLDAMLKEAGTGGVRPNWCELTYINHVTGNGDRPALHELVSVVAKPKSDRFLPPLEDGQLVGRYRIDRSDGSPQGRLTANVSSAVRNVDQLPIWVLTLTVRLKAVGDGLDDAIDTLNKGHEWAIKGFLDVTTPKMQAQWGLQEGSKGENERGS
jgi:uncharacterized protein (TIGR04255 family)